MGRYEFAVVDAVGARIATVNVQAGTLLTFDINQQEAQRVRSAYQSDKSVLAGARGITILAATGSNSRIYLLLSGFRAEDGAPLVVLNSNGEEQQTVRIPMMYQKAVSAAAIVPSAVAVASDRVFVAGADGIVSVYTLPVIP